MKKVKVDAQAIRAAERATETRRVEDARKAKFLPKRFRKMILKQIISHMRIPYDCITGQPGRGEFSITVENVPAFVFKGIFGNAGKIIDATSDAKANNASSTLGENTQNAYAS